MFTLNLAWITLCSVLRDPRNLTIMIFGSRHTLTSVGFEDVCNRIAIVDYSYSLLHD